MDASELGRWTRFAAKGGIGKCTALQDCIAEQAEDLMFMKVSICPLSSRLSSWALHSRKRCAHIHTLVPFLSPSAVP